MTDLTRASRAAMQAGQEYGTCAVCGNTQRLTAKGNLYQHQKRDYLGSATGEQCPGAGKPPEKSGHGSGLPPLGVDGGEV